MIRLAYILAASHSGSTLLAMLLNAHSDVCTVGELKVTNLGDVDRYRCSCGQPIRQCRFWADVGANMARRGFSFDITDARTAFRSVDTAYTRGLLRPLHRGLLLEGLRGAALRLSPAWRTGLPEIQRRNVAIVETLCELTGARIVVDSSKVGLRLKYLLRNSQLDVRVIRLIRDGRAVALTYTDPANYADATDPTLRGGGTGGDRADERLSIAEAAREWRRSNEEAEHILASLDHSRWIEIRYEQLCTDPEATLARLFAFLGVDPTQITRDFRSADHHVLGNGMRLDSTWEIRLDERWRAALTQQDLRAFDSRARKVNRRYGYG